MHDHHSQFGGTTNGQTWSSNAFLVAGFTITHAPCTDAQWSNIEFSKTADSRTGFDAIDCKPNAEDKSFAIDCREEAATRSTALDRLIASSLTDRTREAYRADLECFERWLGRPIPASSGEVAEYLAAMAETLKPATLARRLASISKAHSAAGRATPVSAEIVRAAFRGIKREMGTAQRQAKPLLKEDLCDALEELPATTKGIRDRALLLIGFAGGLRRSELVAIDVAHIEHVRQGILLTVPRSKTDQEGRGRKIGIPFGRGRHCPVKALEAWLHISAITAGPIFRPINRHGQVDGDTRLSGEAVSIIVKEAVERVGLDATLYSGHSLRAGLATSAAMAGVPTYKIRQTTGHASDAMLSRYVRDGDLFTDNAAGRVL